MPIPEHDALSIQEPADAEKPAPAQSTAAAAAPKDSVPSTVDSSEGVRALALRQYQRLSLHQDKAGPVPTMRARILLADDDEDEIFLIRKLLEGRAYEVVPAKNVSEALKLIVAQRFDVLITDLHMPNAGDGLAVVTAMRHLQPEAVTLIVSNYPDLQAAASTMLLAADEVLVKPFDADRLIPLLAKKHPAAKPTPRPAKEHVASILDRDLDFTIQRWLARAEQVGDLKALPVDAKERTEYLPEIIRNITERLRTVRSVEVLERASLAAVAHGQLRYRQGYTAPLIVQESRILQVSIFETIERNVATVDFASLLPDVMIIADEADSQLKQSIGSFLSMQRAMGAPPSA